MIPLPLWLWKLGAAAAVALGLFLSGMAYQAHRDSLARAEAAFHASEDAREQERINARSRANTMDTWAGQLRAESAARVAARSDLDRLRDSLQTGPDPAGAPACEPDRARVRALEQLLAEGAGLVEEGAGHVEALRADRQALIAAYPASAPPR